MRLVVTASSMAKAINDPRGRWESLVRMADPRYGASDNERMMANRAAQRLEQVHGFTRTSPRTAPPPRARTAPPPPPPRARTAPPPRSTPPPGPFGYNPRLHPPDEKDHKRIRDMVGKARDQNHLHQLAGNMAKAITDYSKARRRGNAAAAAGHHSVAAIFHQRAQELA